MKLFSYLFLILKLILINNAYQMNNYYYGISGGGDIDGDIDKKYVNSGQSIILVCDLPTNMPDGPVSFIFFFWIH